jgi:hypothetical protein
LLAEVGRVFRTLGHVPTGIEWDAIATIRRSVIKSRFGGIRNACRITRQTYVDLPIVEPVYPAQRGTFCRGERLGLPMQYPPFSHEPVNETTTQALFATIAPTLGITILKFRSCFPDVMAERRLKSGKIERIDMEVEFRSISYLRHGHPLDRSLILICWIHDWLTIPSTIEIIELRNRFTTKSEFTIQNRGEL